MYIEKRWLVPAGLSLLLLSALVAVILLLLGSTIREQSGRLRLVDISNVAPESGAPESVSEAGASSDRLPFAPGPVAADDPSVASAPEEVVDISTAGTTQINTRGFGDVGLQLQDVDVNAPITIVHVSNQGNINSTNVNTAEDGRNVSEQEQLESNRSDGSTP